MPEEKRDWRKYYNKEVNKRATAKYQKEHMRTIGVKFHLSSDWDILARLDSVGNKVNYIRQLIRDDIKRTGFDPGPKPVKPGDPPPVPPVPVEPVPTREQTPEELAELEAVKKAWGITD